MHLRSAARTWCQRHKHLAGPAIYVSYIAVVAGALTPAHLHSGLGRLDVSNCILQAATLMAAVAANCQLGQGLERKGQAQAKLMSWTHELRCTVTTQLSS